MTATTHPIFTHLFGGWRRAEARRWRNPDGSEGGIVAVSATIHESVTVPASSEIEPEALIGPKVEIGHGVSIGQDSIVDACAVIGDDVRIGSGARIGLIADIGDGVRIGNAAQVGHGAVIGPDASIGCGAHIGEDAVIGSGIRIEGRVRIEWNDWFCVIGPQGTRGAFLTAVHSEADGLRWWAGGRHGISTDELIALVAQEYAGTAHEADYLHAIKTVTEHPALGRATAKAAMRQAA